jgi:hypothetical protein
MLVIMKQVVRQPSVSDEVAQKLAEDGREVPVEELTFDIAFRSEDVRFVDEALQLGDSSAKARVTVHCEAGTRQFFVAEDCREVLSILQCSLN